MLKKAESYKALSLQMTIFLPDALGKALQVFFLTCLPQAFLEKSSLSLTFPFTPLYGRGRPERLQQKAP